MKSLFRIIGFTKELWPLYLTVSIFSVLVALLTQAIPLLTKEAIDAIQLGLGSNSVDTKLIVIIVVAIFACDVAQTFINNIGGYYGDILAAKLRRLLSGRYYQHILTLPQRYFDTELTGTIINRLNRGVQMLTDYMQMFSNNFLQLIVSTVFTIAIVAFYSWPVAVILIILFPTYAWLTTRSSAKWLAYQSDINGFTDQASGRFAESIGQVRVVKSFVHEKLELKRYTGLLDSIIKTTHPQSRYWHTQDTLRRLVLSFLFLLMYLIIFIGTARGTYTLGTMVLLIQFVQLIRLPLFSLSFYVDRTSERLQTAKIIL